MNVGRMSFRSHAGVQQERAARRPTCATLPLFGSRALVCCSVGEPLRGPCGVRARGLPSRPFQAIKFVLEFTDASVMHLGGDSKRRDNLSQPIDFYLKKLDRRIWASRRMGSVGMQHGFLGLEAP